MKNESSIKKGLIKTYGIDEYFYPKHTMGIDIPNLEHEIKTISSFLTKITIVPEEETIYAILSTKQKLLELYSSEEKKSVLDEFYQKTIAKDQPVGGVIPLELVYASLFSFFLTMAITFFAAFSEESGKILARKLFDNEKKEVKKMLNVSDEVIELYEQEYLSFNKTPSGLEIFYQKLTKLKK